MYALSKFLTVFDNAFPTLSKGISGVIDAVGEATGVFGKLKAAGTSTFKGIGSLISAHPFIAITTAITTIYTIWKKVDEHFGISLKESKNKLDEVKSECSELESELSSLNDEFETTQNKIDALEAKGKV